MCLQWIHKNCANFYQNSSNNATENNSYWCCMNCVQLFPLHAISDEEFSSILLDVDASKSLLGNCISKFKLFSTYLYKFCNFENYVNRDNFYNYIKYIIIYINYWYIWQVQKKSKTSKGFSTIHFNFTSLLSNINKIIDYLQYLNLMLATWLNLYYNLDVLNLVGYDLCSKTIQSKRGGGVAMYIRNDIRFKV